MAHNRGCLNDPPRSTYDLQWVKLHPFSLQFEHPADADCVPAAVGRWQKDVPYLCALPALQDLVVLFFVALHLPGWGPWRFHCICFVTVVVSNK